jgi:hypothetical protein
VPGARAHRTFLPCGGASSSCLFVLRISLTCACPGVSRDDHELCLDRRGESSAFLGPHISRRLSVRHGSPIMMEIGQRRVPANHVWAQVGRGRQKQGERCRIRAHVVMG